MNLREIFFVSSVEEQNCEKKNKIKKLKLCDSPFLHFQQGIRTRRLLDADELLRATGILFLISAFYRAMHQTCEQSLEATVHPSESR